MQTEFGLVTSAATGLYQETVHGKQAESTSPRPFHCAVWGDGLKWHLNHFLQTMWVGRDSSTSCLRHENYVWHSFVQYGKYSSTLRPSTHNSNITEWISLTSQSLTCFQTLQKVNIFWSDTYLWEQLSPVQHRQAWWKRKVIPAGINKHYGTGESKLHHCSVPHRGFGWEEYKLCYTQTTTITGTSKCSLHFIIHQPD